MRFGEKLRIWLLLEFGTISKAAEIFEMKQGDLSRYVTGKREPGYKFFVKIAKYKAPLHWMLTETDEEIIMEDYSKEMIEKLTKELLQKNKKLVYYQEKLEENKEQLKVFEKISSYINKSKQEG